MIRAVGTVSNENISMTGDGTTDRAGNRTDGRTGGRTGNRAREVG